MGSLNIDNHKNEVRKRIKNNNIDEKIFDEKKKIKKINELQEEIVLLNKHMIRCIDLLSSSLNQGKNNSSFANMYDENMMDLKKTMSILDEKISSYKNNIAALYKEQDKMNKEHDIKDK